MPVPFAGGYVCSAALGVASSSALNAAMNALPSVCSSGLCDLIG